MSAELAEMQPTYNNITAGALCPGGVPFPFRASVTSAKALAYYPRPWQLSRIRNHL